MPIEMCKEEQFMRAEMDGSRYEKGDITRQRLSPEFQLEPRLRNGKHRKKCQAKRFRLRLLLMEPRSGLMR